MRLGHWSAEGQTGGILPVSCLGMWTTSEFLLLDGKDSDNGRNAYGAKKRVDWQLLGLELVLVLFLLQNFLPQEV